MLFSPDTFLHALRQIVTGGGRDSDGHPKSDSGYLKRAEGVDLQSITPSSAVTATAAALTDNSGGSANTTLAAIDASMIAVGGSGMTTAQESEYDTTMGVIADNFADLAAQVNALIVDNANLRAQLGLTADETHARVLKVEETVDEIGNIVWPVPRDYDEATDTLKVRVLASQLTQTTDDDVELDMEAYVKTAGSALGADLNPTAPGTVLSTTEQWIEFDLGGNGLQRDDVLTIELLTDGHNDTNGEEVLIHALEMVYRSTIVSYDDEADASGYDLR